MPVDEILRVPYNLPGSQNWQWINIYTRLSQERIIFLNQPLTMGVANSIISALLYLESEDNTKPIYLYINSLGDPVAAGMADETAGLSGITAALAVYDTLQYIKSEVVTICLGQAYGVATLLLSSGTRGKRSSLPNAMIALMQPQVATQGQATDIQVSVKAVLEKRSLMMSILSENTGKSVETLTHDMDRMFYMTPTEAKAYGLVDRVLDTP